MSYPKTAPALFRVIPLAILVLTASASASSFDNRNTLNPADVSQPAPPASATVPLEKADVVGFWALDSKDEEGSRVNVEFFFSNDQKVEARNLIEIGAGTGAAHAFGTWTLENELIVIKPDPSRCKTTNPDFTDCSDKALDTIYIGEQAGARFLLKNGSGMEGAIAFYFGSEKSFELPDMFSASAISRKRTVIGSGFGNGQAAISGFDILGRNPGARTVSGMRFPIGR